MPQGEETGGGSGNEPERGALAYPSQITKPCAAGMLRMAFADMGS